VVEIILAVAETLEEEEAMVVEMVATEVMEEVIVDIKDLATMVVTLDIVVEEAVVVE
jgi:hypothetical protein